jgi:hypothetical protein
LFLEKATVVNRSQADHCLRVAGLTAALAVADARVVAGDALGARLRVAELGAMAAVRVDLAGAPERHTHRRCVAPGVTADERAESGALVADAVGTGARIPILPLGQSDGLASSACVDACGIEGRARVDAVVECDAIGIEPTELQGGQALRR